VNLLKAWVRKTTKTQRSFEAMKDPDEITRKLAEEFAVLLNPKTTLTPHLFRKGCKHYDTMGDQKSAEFREFCWKSKDSRIERGSVCENFESKNPSLPEGVLTF